MTQIYAEEKVAAKRHKDRKKDPAFWSVGFFALLAPFCGLRIPRYLRKSASSADSSEISEVRCMR